MTLCKSLFKKPFNWDNFTPDTSAVNPNNRGFKCFVVKTNSRDLRVFGVKFWTEQKWHYATLANICANLITRTLDWCTLTNLNLLNSPLMFRPSRRGFQLSQSSHIALLNLQKTMNYIIILFIYEYYIWIYEYDMNIWIYFSIFIYSLSRHSYKHILYVI